ncbi:MAG: hypothetical protein GQ559_06655 [Desulfobulbaceae bacterium]|nr:hypothetical protein [Desulfobulbaceae bacterium]
MDFKFHFENAWKVFTTHLVALLISTIALVGVSIITLGIMAPVVTAGYMQSLLLAMRDGRKPEVRDLFAHMDLFLPLLGFAILVGLAIFVGLVMLVLPGLLVILAVAFFCMYMLPLMTDGGMSLFDALKESGRMAMQPPVSEHLVVIAVYLVLSSIGNSTGLGALFTQPFVTLFVLSVYETKLTRLLPGPQPQTGNEPSPPPSGK